MKIATVYNDNKQNISNCQLKFVQINIQIENHVQKLRWNTSLWNTQVYCGIHSSNKQTENNIWSVSSAQSLQNTAKTYQEQIKFVNILPLRNEEDFDTVPTVTALSTNSRND